MGEDVTKLTASVIALEAEASAVAHRLGFERQKLTEAHLTAKGLRIGGLVKAKGKLFRIVDADIWSFRSEAPSISLHGNPQRKDGSFGTARQYIGTNWEPT